MRRIPIVKHTCQRALIVGALILLSGTAFAERPLSLNAEAQARATQLLQDALGPFRSLEGPKNSRTNTAWENSLRIESALREASRLLPERLDLRFDIATALIGQATQTNGAVLEEKIRAALAVYQEIRALDTNGFEAGILYAAYARAFGESSSSDAMLHELSALHATRTREYSERFERVEGFLAVSPNEAIRSFGHDGQQHAILVLGAALETNGLAKAKLVGRLQQALKLARANPLSAIIVTGGNQKKGVTEAYVMRAWLRRHGIPERRIHMEDLARDTVGNALYSAAIIEKLKVTDVTVVTSVSHIRRGLANLDEACRRRALSVACANLASEEVPPVPDKAAERIATYRDVMRVSGLWAYPGFSR